MGMPSYLNRKFLKSLKSDLAFKLLLAGASCDQDIFFYLLNEVKVSRKKIIIDHLKGRFRFENLLYYREDKQDKLDKIKARVYVGFEEQSGCFIAQYADVKISISYLEKLDNFNDKREAIDRENLELSYRIALFKNKIYASRFFPQKLKQVIFQRDNYSCQLCGKHRELLISEGLHLEVDHIIECEDGGQTTYSNGQTLCSACNKGKHHAKKLMQKI